MGQLLVGIILYIVCFVLAVISIKHGMKNNDSTTKKVGVGLAIVNGLMVCIFFDIGVDSGPMIYFGSGSGMNLINIFLAFVFGMLPICIGIYLGNRK